MKVILQRVKSANCIVDGKIISKINEGLLILVGFSINDDATKLSKMAHKILNLRVFEDSNKKMNLSLKDVNGEILSISQFTLYANPYSGNRPSFIEAMPGECAKQLYENFNNELEKDNLCSVKRGVFGADMQLNVVCDGPVTITLEY